MSAIAYFLEAAGIATTGISLVRENTAAMAPPRFLWVPFPLGRPLGVPGDAAFQHRVIAASLALLSRSRGPVLEDFDEDLPANLAGEPDSGRAFVCPVSFPPAPPEGGDLARRIVAEIALLRPWYDLAVQRRGRSTVGLSGRDVSDLAGQDACAARPEDADPLAEAGFSPLDLKYAVEDLKAFYLEAAAGQPGAQQWQRSADWLWRETALGEAMLALHARVVGHGGAVQAALSGCLVPRRALV